MPNHVKASLVIDGETFAAAEGNCHGTGNNPTIAVSIGGVEFIGSSRVTPDEFIVGLRLLADKAEEAHRRWKVENVADALAAPMHCTCSLDRLTAIGAVDVESTPALVELLGEDGARDVLAAAERADDAEGGDR